MTGHRPWLDGRSSCTHSWAQHLTGCFVSSLEILINGSSQEHWSVLGSSGAWSLSSAPHSPLPAALTVMRVAGSATGPHLHWVFLPRPWSPPGPWMESERWTKEPSRKCLRFASRVLSWGLPPAFEREAPCLCLWLFGVWTVYPCCHAGIERSCGLWLPSCTAPSDSQFSSDSEMRGKRCELECLQLQEEPWPLGSSGFQLLVYWRAVPWWDMNTSEEISSCKRIRL